jgi:hypothetical protein
MLNCKETTELIAGDHLENASWSKRLWFWMHIFMCRHCRRYKRQMQLIGRAARDLFRSSADREDTARIKRLQAEILDNLPPDSGLNTQDHSE